MTRVNRAITVPALLAIAAAYACAPSTPTPESADARPAAIELLGFPGCPNTPALRRNLRDALDSLGPGRSFANVDQEALPAADPRCAWPAPTILVNGADLFGMAIPTTPAAGCRLYPGTPDGVPDATAIAERLRICGVR